MAFLARIFRFVFWMLIVSWSVAILRRIVRNMGRGAGPGSAKNSSMDIPSDAVSRKLVRDPMCGMHIAEGLALPVKQGSEVLHFCSAECRDRYLSKSQKFAANA
jgi:YHS domain-containing protein